MVTGSHMAALNITKKACAMESRDDVLGALEVAGKTGTCPTKPWDEA